MLCKSSLLSVNKAVRVSMPMSVCLTSEESWLPRLLASHQLALNPPRVLRQTLCIRCFHSLPLEISVFDLNYIPLCRCVKLNFPYRGSIKVHFKLIFHYNVSPVSTLLLPLFLLCPSLLPWLVSFYLVLLFHVFILWVLFSLDLLWSQAIIGWCTDSQTMSLNHHKDFCLLDNTGEYFV